jgi:hypothetical protein
MSDDLAWFAARIVLESQHPDEDEAPGDKLYEERIILIRAPSEEAAHEKAVRFGEDSREEYKNSYGRTVIWAFKELLDVKPIFDDVIQDGTEIYAAFLAHPELERVRQSLQPAGRSTLQASGAGRGQV